MVFYLRTLFLLVISPRVKRIYNTWAADEAWPVQESDMSELKNAEYHWNLEASTVRSTDFKQCSLNYSYVT